MPDRPGDVRPPRRPVTAPARSRLPDRGRLTLPEGARGRQILVVAGLVVALLAASVGVFGREANGRPGGAIAAMPARLAAMAPDAGAPPAGPAPGDAPPPEPGSVGVYAGLGTWLDAFDYAPAYNDPGTSPAVAPSEVGAMAAAGVSTLYLQASRLDDVSTDLLVDRRLLAEILLRAHGHGMRVVAWYLPRLGDVGADLARLMAIADFRVLGHRFDGVALDIEDTKTVPDPAARSLALVDLSTRLRSATDSSSALGAIVLPPVLTELVNPRSWPDFPWASLAPLFDVWLPMSYWTFRKPESGYRDGYAYTAESVQRLRSNLGEPEALVHPIGGIADIAEPAEVDGFVRSLTDTGSIGGSLYDWATSGASSRQQLTTAFATGPGAALPRP